MQVASFVIEPRAVSCITSVQIGPAALPRFLVNVSGSRHFRLARLELVLAAASEHETPIGVVDEGVRERNLERMQAMARARGFRLRPHAKTHKSVHVARRQVELGAVGLTVATLHEAWVFLEAGIDDLLLTNVPFGDPKMKRLEALCDRAHRVAVAVDSLLGAHSLPDRVDVLWEVDTGLHRLGTAPGQATVEAVSNLVTQVGSARFRGLMTHGGHAYRAESDADLQRATEEEVGGLLVTADMLRAAGIRVAELSVGSTPTSRYWTQVGGATEVRPGTYVYGDANQVQLGSQALTDCAFVVVATVVSTPEATRAVIDAGSKALSLDLRVPGVDSCGLVLDRPDLRLDRLGEELGILLSENATGLRIGDRVAIVPNHVCTSLNLHAEVLAIGETGRARWESVDARGWRTRAAPVKR